MKKYKRVTIYPNKFGIIRDKRIFDNVIKVQASKRLNSITIYQKFTSDKSKVIVQTQLKLDRIAEIKEESVTLYE